MRSRLSQLWVDCYWIRVKPGSNERCRNRSGRKVPHISPTTTSDTARPPASGIRHSALATHYLDGVGVGAGRSASDALVLSAGGVLCGVTLPAGFDAPTDSLPRLVVVGGGSRCVCWGLSVVSGFAASWRGVERLVDPVPGGGLGEGFVRTSTMAASMASGVPPWRRPAVRTHRSR
jgi:hypothetical protein